MKDQEQTVGDGSVAIQSFGDTNIVNHGVRPEEIRIIVQTMHETAIADQVRKHTDVALVVFEERLIRYRDEILARFEKDKTANRDAFADPDFQHVLIESQAAFARTGADDAQQTLLDLIVERSRQKPGKRMAFILNRALSVTPQLGAAELAALGILFYMRWTRRQWGRSLEDIAAHMHQVTSGLVSEVDNADAVCKYLTAQQCSTNGTGNIYFLQYLRMLYPTLFFRGLTPQLFEQALSTQGLFERIPDEMDALLFPSSFHAGHFRPRALFEDEFRSQGAALGWSPLQLNSVWSMMANSTISDPEAFEILEKSYPDIRQLATLLDGSMRYMDLTSLGIAIGHSRLSVLNWGSLPLDQWIK